jgi:hypothetical protein
MNKCRESISVRVGRSMRFLGPFDYAATLVLVAVYVIGTSMDDGPGTSMGLIEVVHWAFGAAGGAVFGALPRRLRRRPWAGGVYGLAVWLGFEMGIAPALGLSQAKRVRLVDRLALAADHLLYGLVLSEPRRRARD